MYAVVVNGVVGFILPMNTAFVLDNRQYPPNWLSLVTAECREALGIYPVVKDARPTERYAFIVENAPIWDADAKVVRITYSTKPHSLEQVKSAEIARMTDHGQSLLAMSDKFVLAAHDERTPVLGKWVMHRSAVRNEIKRLRDGINNATDVKSVVDVLLTAKWAKPE